MFFPMFLSPGYLFVMFVGMFLLGAASSYVKRTDRRRSGARQLDRPDRGPGGTPGARFGRAGAAVQDSRGFAPTKLRAGVLPAANLGGQLGVTMIIIGLILMTVLRGLATIGFGVAVVGLLLFSCVLVFQLVTLPVEFDASHPGMGLLRTAGIINHEDLAGARSVLTAAALTYVAATASTALQVAYWGMQVFSRRD